MLTVYVPGPDCPLTSTVLPGSALVAEGDAGGPTLVYYEGGRFDPTMSYHTKVDLAAGRLLQRYPTAAVATADVVTLTAVGHYHAGWRTLQVTNRDALASWLAVAPAELDTALGAPLPPVVADRTDPDYPQRLSARIVAGAPLSSAEVHDIAARPHRLTTAALHRLGLAGR